MGKCWGQRQRILEQVRLEFDQWRRQRGGKGRIPERLWDLATRATGTDGVRTVSRELGLDFTRLKKRVSKRNAEAEASVPTLGSGFIDLGRLNPIGGQPSSGCLVEIEKENGTFMRVRVVDGTCLDWQWIKEAFLQA